MNTVTNNQKAFISLTGLGLGLPIKEMPSIDDWTSLLELATQQGLMAIVMDGIDSLPDEKRPPKELLLQWIGLVIQDEARYFVQHKAAREMSFLFHENYIRTYVLKGDVIAECYPKPSHRVSVDVDCYLLSKNHSGFDTWALGNDIMRANNIDVVVDYYKDSTFYLPGLSVENHRYLTPFRGNKRLKLFEIMLQSMLHEDDGEDKFDGTWLYRPPVMVSALFIVEHSYSHFLHEGLTWRHVLDWKMFLKRHKSDLDWKDFSAYIDEFGFRKFYNSFNNLGRYLLGEIPSNELTKNDKRILDDIWAELDVPKSLRGFRAKVSMALGTCRAWWKYYYFSEISVIHALWIQVYGFLFDKNPTLD